jgi:hypothetical protein
MDDHQ